ncbi:GNAT family N-acetyltransferase [Bacillus daqingensis]|uniref:GNAT family N-acetyltransferase n=1 Tax=Bacillus daqingensis TaxID=872396 RepID=A0ABV9NXX7_9BACI
MSHHVRPMTSDDIPSVQEVAVRSWKDTYEGIIPEASQERFLQAAYSTERMELRLERSRLFVAEEEGRVVGFISTTNVNEEGKAMLGAIYLLPEVQGNGIGTKLLDAAISALSELQELYVEVEKDNRSGKAFYDAKGFTFVREYDDPIDGHVLKTVEMVLEVKQNSGASASVDH